MPVVIPTLPTTFTVPFSLPVGGTTWTPANGTELQTALDSSSLGDVIRLTAGITYEGNFKCPVKSGSGWLYVISSELANLPPENWRVHPIDKIYMPTIRVASTLNRPGLSFFENAHHYRFVGIEFKNDSSLAMVNMIMSGYGGTYSNPSYQWTLVNSDAKLPSNITFDRCYIHNSNVWPLSCRCGYLCNGHYMAVVDSYFENFIDSADSQAINLIQGTGPYKIVNNYLEATGENFLIGGTDPLIPGAIPEDVEFRKNYCYKNRSAWEPHWTIKNTFELKYGRRVLITENLMENIYKDDQGQGATAIVLTVRNEGGNNPNSQLQDITITKNRIHTCGKCWRLTGYDDRVGFPTLQSQRILIEQNAWDDVNNLATSPNEGQISSPIDGPAKDVAVRHNLFFGTTDINSLTFLTAPTGSKAVENFTCENNIYMHGDFGLFGSVVGTGTVALNTFANGYSWTKNVMINRSTDSAYAFWKTHLSSYPSGNDMADEVASVGFTDVANSDYSLTPTSPYHNWGTDGLDPGPDWAVLGPLVALARNGTALTPDSISINSITVQPRPIRTLKVVFTTVGITGNVKMELSRDNGVSYIVAIASQPYYEGNLNYVVDTNVGGFCKVRITSLDDPGLFVISDTFSLGERYKARIGRQTVGVIS